MWILRGHNHLVHEPPYFPVPYSLPPPGMTAVLCCLWLQVNPNLDNGVNPSLDNDHRDNLCVLCAGHSDMPLDPDVRPVVLIPQKGKLRLREKSRSK